MNGDAYLRRDGVPSPALEKSEQLIEHAFGSGIVRGAQSPGTHPGSPAGL
jgi:hypothetical protein